MSHSSKIAALLAAAGAGQRLNADSHAAALPPKAFITLAGRPLLLHSLAALRASGAFDQIIVIAPAELVEETQALLVATPERQEAVIMGGATRQESVYRGLQALTPDIEYVLIHDAARPFLSQAMITACLSAAQAHGAATCAVPVTDTIKTSADDQFVEQTLARSRLWSIQTPQAFSYPLILQAHEAARQQRWQASDDAMLVEQLGRPVFLAPGAPENIKVTYRADLAQVEQKLARQTEQTMETRVGLGFDAHAFGEGRKLILAGVEFPGPGLLGHSDADLVCHAAADALLGAAGLGDIGGHFPDTDPQYAGASSIKLLTQVGQLAAQAGYQITSLDIVIATQAPKIAPHVPQMRAQLAQALGISADRVSLKGKTTEGLGFTGRQEGMACWAVCQVTKSL